MTTLKLQDRVMPECAIVDYQECIHVPNVPMMRKILDTIRHDPNAWVQRDWVWNESRPEKTYDEARDLIRAKTTTLVTPEICGTAFCFAGHAAMLSDDPLKFQMQDFTAQNGRKSKFKAYVDETELGFEAQDRAMHELGLLEDEADSLFDGSNSFGTLKRVCKRIAKSVGEEL